MFTGLFWRPNIPRLRPPCEKLILDNWVAGSRMEASPPIPVRIEWADSQGRVTASWLTAHFSFPLWTTDACDRSQDRAFLHYLCCAGMPQCTGNPVAPYVPGTKSAGMSG